MPTSAGFLVPNLIIYIIYYYLLSIALFSKLGLDKGGQWYEIEHKIGEGQRSGEGKVDGDVGPGFEDLVQLDAGVAVPLHQVVRPVQVPI